MRRECERESNRRAVPGHLLCVDRSQTPQLLWWLTNLMLLSRLLIDNARITIIERAYYTDRARVAGCGRGSDPVVGMGEIAKQRPPV